MRLKVSRSKNAASFYVTKSIYEGKKQRTIIVEKLGTEKELCEKLHGQDPCEWAKSYVEELNRREKEESRPVMVPRVQSRVIPKGQQNSFHGGYLFLQSLYYQLGLPGICAKIAARHKLDFSLDTVLARLLYDKILYPGASKSALPLSGNGLKRQDFGKRQVCRTLEILAKESDFIQAELYKQRVPSSGGKDEMLYCDCTDYCFQKGPEEEQHLDSDVKMKLYMDKEGMPLAFFLQQGDTEEQSRRRSLEEKIRSDFGEAGFSVYGDGEKFSKEVKHMDRWHREIEECFRIPRNDFGGQPAGLCEEDMIRAYFTVCFLVLTFYRHLERKLGEEFTYGEIIKKLREMSFLRISGEGYIPIYTRSGLTDALHEAFGFRTDYEIVTEKQMREILKKTRTCKEGEHKSRKQKGESSI